MLQTQGLLKVQFAALSCYYNHTSEHIARLGLSAVPHICQYALSYVQPHAQVITMRLLLFQPSGLKQQP
jgi:hypothetical protein